MPPPYVRTIREEILYELHEKAGTLDVRKQDVAQLCPRCRNGPACEKWEKVKELTCLCLESVF